MLDLLPRAAEIQRLSPAAIEDPAADLDCSDRMDRITSVVLCQLFDLAQQAARFGSGINPWGQLAAYDGDDFALFTAGGST
ncbi:hypothetical protein ABZ612_31060 [Streptomyces avermitilis]|uniref:hypothetical protein n=1 Tax=Streptomyces avermitilis TaxID=33903 RepID=UPI00340303AF